MEQIERIKHYENILNEGEKLIKEYDNILEKLLAFKGKKEELDKYYQSKIYLEDLNASENNLLPKDLCCGVLGEDYTWDFLTRYEEILKDLEDLKD